MRLALSAFMGDGKREEMPFGLMVFDVEKATVRLVLQGPTWCNMHPQYCRSTDAEAAHELLVQENHGNVAPATGSIVRTFDPARQSPARRFFGAWMIWMHNGQFFGLSGRVLLVATGLVLALLFPSGLYVWLRRRPARLRGRVHEPRHRSS